MVKLNSVTKLTRGKRLISQSYSLPLADTVFLWTPNCSASS
jgi:hypothetical protein